jgi:hypothetical protein
MSNEVYRAVDQEMARRKAIWKTVPNPNGNKTFQKIVDWWSLWKFERYIKRDIKQFIKDAEKQVAVYQTAVDATLRAFEQFRTVIAETQVAEEGWDYVDLGDGAGVQVFKGRTQKEAIAAIVKAQRNTNAISHNFKK